MKYGLSKLDCANPECAAPFNFRRGRLYRFYLHHFDGNAHSTNQYSLKHLWLCKKCTELYTLEYQKGMELLIPRPAPKCAPAVAHSDAPLLHGETSLRQSAKPQSRLSREVYSETRKDEANKKPLTYAARALLSWLVNCIGILTR